METPLDTAQCLGIHSERLLAVRMNPKHLIRISGQQMVIPSDTGQCLDVHGGKLLAVQLNPEHWPPPSSHQLPLSNFHVGVYVHP